MSESVKVAVRVRPFNQREKDRDAKLVIDMRDATTVIKHPDSGEEKKFTFDHSYWSHDGFTLEENGYARPEDDRYADQGKVFDDLGVGLLENAWQGYNCCVFAYGQTGSGKSYSIVGYEENKGIIPLVCADLFRRIDEASSDDVAFRVQVTMLEIYNEKLRDLLNPKTANDQLKIRTSSSGMYVENIKEVAVDSYKSIEKQMDVGTRNRTVGATQMNATSSRAHTVFTINFTKIEKKGGLASEVKASLNLVDLAGSERANSTGATGARLKEGAAINQSLSNLGLVISALAEQANNPKKKVLVPYRASKLTMLLQNALGGNSKTVMLAALSPADINYEETLSTLRYADRAKQIKTVAVVQENPTDRLIRELREENARLQKMVADGGTPSAAPTSAGITESELKAAIEEAVFAVRKVSAEEKEKAIAAAIARYEAQREPGSGEADASGQKLVTEADVKQALTHAIQQLTSLTDDEREEAILATRDSSAWRSGANFRMLIAGQKKGLAHANLSSAIARTVLSQTKGSGAVKFRKAIEAAKAMALVEDMRRAKEQLEANEKKIAMLSMSWEQQLEATKDLERERAEALRQVGLEELSAEDMRSTCSLVNLSDDPLMSGRLMYWLRSDTLTLGAADSSDIVLKGMGVQGHHATLTKREGQYFLKNVAGTTFVNGKELKEETALEHNARIIIGSTNLLRFNDPVAAAKARAEGVAPRAVIDWDFAQRELTDALGATVSLKVEEEIQKEKEALEEKAKELEAKFQAERDEMASELERLRASANAEERERVEREEQRLRELDEKIKSVDGLRKAREASIAQYRRDLLRLEDTLLRLNPVVGESNAIATQMGRKVAMAIKLVTTIPEQVNQSEELWAGKTTDLMIKVTLTGHTAEVSRSWLWSVDEFYERIFVMREQYQLFLRQQAVAPRRSPGDPFWAPPRPELIGKAFFFLTPLAHRAGFADWLPILDMTGKTQGELRVSARCTAANHIDPAEAVADPSALLGQPLHFTLRVDSARSLLSDNTVDTYVRFNFAEEDTPRLTDVCEGRATAPSFEFKEPFDIPKVDERMLKYLQSDALCFEVWGQGEEIAEGTAEGAAIERPPEIFDFFVGVDIHEATTEVRGSDWIEAAWDRAITRDGKPALYITQKRARRLIVSVTQQQKTVFTVSKFAHVWLGNLRDEHHVVWDASFLPVTIAEQKRTGDRYELLCEWYSQFDCLDQAAAAGKVFYLDLKLECTELDRLVLEETVMLTRRVAVSVEAEPKQAGGVLAGLKAKAAARRILKDGEGNGIQSNPERLRRMEEHQQHYMGNWDITGEAIDVAMASLKSSAIADTGKEIKRQLHEMDEGLQALQSKMMEEQGRQLTVLSRQLKNASQETTSAIEEKTKEQQRKQEAAQLVLERVKLTEAAAPSKEKTDELEKARQEAVEKAKELELEKARLQKELDEARRQLEETPRGGKVTPRGGKTPREGRKSAACSVQ